ncbi:MmgE/PrpD family protein [Aquicoccus sp. G2-2]|uniref:MmgE/PrpD family protein n=1 Tax=Aquicoccus sp. G2-2 TaxID=3092120 RepID=UPI002AE003A4|nr:MmgE/PrpD family protein [Aquicoccus sp. G2-2]MEA1113316.1 MmgE/PrpD family protein [Aquicoccus sp. G2-2]
MNTPITFLHNLAWADLPALAQQRTRLSLLDLIGIAAAAQHTDTTPLITSHASTHFAGPHPMLFSDQTASHPGAALAGGMRIDSLDGHDGFNPAKGHIGCALFPAALTLAHAKAISGEAFLATIAMGYEFGARAAMAQHGSVPDYHTSGSWGAVTVAAAAARLLALPDEQTRHALGIAEYHGPRSQMMREIDHPTMLKDGSGWGAMAGLSAAFLAADGFTGAPALTVEEITAPWADLGQRWYVTEQYFKPYPVCRWAQAPIEGVLALRRAHALTAADVKAIEIESFHECIRLATATPTSSDAAQYSTSFPCAIALVHGDVRPEHLTGTALSDPETLRLSQATTMREHEHANAAFPLTRLARTTLTLKDGTKLTSDWMQPRWDHTAPPTAAELRAKYHALADPILGPARATAIEETIDTLESRPLTTLSNLLLAPV